MHGFVQKVRRQLLDHALIEPDHVVVAAVSGGADSVSMLRALLELRFEVVVAHIDHRCRPGTDLDASFVEDLAKRIGCAFTGLAVDPGSGSENDLRRARYSALLAVGGDRLATGHTLNDQAETVLMRMLRGSGTAGLAGIPPRNGRVVRPLLGVTRQEVLRYLEHLGQPFVEDPTNASLDPLRNRVRHVLLPLLRRDFQPNAVRSLARLADACRTDREALEDAAAKHLAEHGLDVASLRALHPGLLPHVLRRSCEVPITSERMRAIQRLVATEQGAVQIEGGITALIDKRQSKGLPKRHGRLVFTKAPSQPAGRPVSEH